ncbi:MAG: AI-2E family transporter [Peptococcaceae bacterium]|nr:AI-2E family transporter [Peptococcaceae bacterium]
MEFPKISIPKLLLVVFAMALIIYAVFNLKQVGEFIGGSVNLIKPFLLGAVIAFVLNVPLRFFERRVFSHIDNARFRKFERGLSVLLSILIVWAVVGIVVSVVLPQLVESTTLFISALPNYIDILIDFLRTNGGDSQIIKDAIKQIETISPSALEKYLTTFLGDQLTVKNTIGSAVMSTVGVISSVASSLFNLVVAFVFGIYILVSKEKLAVQARKICFAFLSKDRASYVVHVAQVSFAKLYSFITGQLTEAVILGSLCTIGMMVLRLPYSGMIGVLTGFCALIPIFGAFIGGAVGALLILTVSPIKALTFIIFLVILQQVEGNLIYPRVVGGSVGLPAMWTLFAITIGGSLLGLVGMMLFVPLVAILYYLFSEIVHGMLNKHRIALDDPLITDGIQEEIRL